MNDDQKKWLTDVGGKAVLQQKLSERQALKDAVAGKLGANIASKAGEIHTAMNRKATTGGKKPKTQKLLSGKGQIDEFDIDEMEDGYALETADHEQQLKAHHLVTQMSKDMDIMVDKIDPDTGAVIMEDVDELDSKGKPTGKTIKQPAKEPLFTKEEISKELYQPMVRGRLIPETFVPNEFSATKEMLDG